MDFDEDPPRRVLTGRARVAAGALAATLAVPCLAGTSALAGPPPGKGKPFPTATTTISATPTSTTVDPEPSPSPTSTDTASPSSSPTAASSPEDCGEWAYYARLFQGQWYSPGGTTGVLNGDYGIGARIYISNTDVMGVAGNIVTIAVASYGGGGDTCTGEGFCTAGWQNDVYYSDYLDVDFTGISPVPEVDTRITQYGITGEPGVLNPVGFELIYPCGYSCPGY